MESLLAGFTTTNYLALGLAVALLFAGRRLYWLALGGIGFFMGLWLADRFIDLRSTGLELGLAFLIGILGAYLAASAQRVAISLGGSLVGGALAYWTAFSLAGPMNWQPGLWIQALTLCGAILGALMAAVLFEASLVALTSLIGAMMIMRLLSVGSPHNTWLFLILLAIGMVAQTGGQQLPRNQRAAT
ncbi:MAG: DUF4203 domain-containing protein [Acidobacteriota bacterium]